MKDNIYLDEESWSRLKEAAPHFETAIRDYIRNAPRWLTEQVIDVYESATGNKLYSKDLSCAVCVLRIYQAASTLYFYNLKEREKILKEENAKDNNNSSEVSKSNSGNKEKNKRSIKKDPKGTKQNKDN